MSELIYLNDQARSWHENRGATAVRQLVPVGSGLELVSPSEAEVMHPPETDIQPSDWTIIEDIACDPELVACVELQQLGYTEVNLSDARLEVIEDIGLAGVQEGILETTRIGEANFAVALAMCKETVREKYGLDEQSLNKLVE